MRTEPDRYDPCKKSNVVSFDMCQGDMSLLEGYEICVLFSSLDAPGTFEEVLESEEKE